MQHPLPQDLSACNRWHLECITAVRVLRTLCNQLPMLHKPPIAPVGYHGIHVVIGGKIAGVLVCCSGAGLKQVHNLLLAFTVPGNINAFLT